MSEKKGLVTQLRDAGQLIVATAAVATLLGGFAVKAWGWAMAGPTALTETQILKKDVRRLKRQSRFTVKILEKLGKEKYDWRMEDREVALEEPE